MPPKRSPSPSSSDSESGSSPSSSEEEQQQRQRQQKKTQKSRLFEKPLPKKPSATSTPAVNPSSSPPNSSHSGSEDDEDEDEASGGKAAPADSNTKPPPPRRGSRGPDLSKKATSEQPKPPPTSELEGKEKKKRKEPEAPEEEEAAAAGPSGKKPFQRVWTEVDEIALLEGMIEFHAEHDGADPASVLDAFRGFISKSLHSEFSKTQLYDKMRRLRDKYQKNLRRGESGGGPPFTCPHEQAKFELSKKIWHGKTSNSTPFPASPSEGRGGTAASKGSPLVDRETEEGRAGASHPTLRDAVARLGREKGDTLMSGSLWKALELLKPAKAKSLEEVWHNHVVAGMQYYLERSELEKDLMKSLIEALKSA